MKNQKERLKKMATEIFNMRLKDQTGIDNYFLDVFFREYVGVFFPKIVECFNHIWESQTVVKQSYGDRDCTIQKLEDTELKRVMYIENHCSTAPITRFLIIYNKIKTHGGYKEVFHIRKVWDDEITDYVKDNHNSIVSFPNLQWYKDRELSVEYVEKLHMTILGSSYGDCRDRGYVLTNKRYICCDDEYFNEDWDFDLYDQNMMNNFQHISFVANELIWIKNELK